MASLPSCGVNEETLSVASSCSNWDPSAEVTTAVSDSRSLCKGLQMGWHVVLDFFAAYFRLKACRKMVGELSQERNLLWQERNRLRERIKTLEAQNAELLGERQNIFTKLCDILGQTVVGPIDIPKKLQEVVGLVADLKGQVRALSTRVEQLESGNEELRDQLTREQSRCGELRVRLRNAEKRLKELESSRS